MSTLPKLGTHLVPMMLNRGDSVAIKCGALVVLPASGLPIPQKWLDDNSIDVVTEILQQTGKDGLLYIDYSTGNYYKNVASGVTLQFQYLMTGAKAYAIFNADLTRSRNTKNGKAGDPLPTGQFNLAEGAEFIKFWNKAGVKKPSSRTEFHKRMGNLKTLIFTGDPHPTKQDRLVSDSIKPLEITLDEILKAYNLSDSSAIIERQLCDNPAIRVSDKKTLQASETLGLQTDSTAGAICYGKTVISKKVIRDNVYPTNDVNEAISDIPEYPNEPPGTREWIIDIVIDEFEEQGRYKYSRSSDSEPWPQNECQLKNNRFGREY